MTEIMLLFKSILVPEVYNHKDADWANNKVVPGLFTDGPLDLASHSEFPSLNIVHHERQYSPAHHECSPIEHAPYHSESPHCHFSFIYSDDFLIYSLLLSCCNKYIHWEDGYNRETHEPTDESGDVHRPGGAGMCMLIEIDNCEEK